MYQILKDPSSSKPKHVKHSKNIINRKSLTLGEQQREVEGKSRRKNHFMDVFATRIIQRFGCEHVVYNREKLKAT